MITVILTLGRLEDEVRSQAEAAQVADIARDLTTPKMVHCLSNRTLWFMGNSVSRGHFYAVRAMLGLGLVDRQEQKLECGAGGPWKGRRQVGGVPLNCNGACACYSYVPTVSVNSYDEEFQYSHRDSARRRTLRDIDIVGGHQLRNLLCEERRDVSLKWPRLTPMGTVFTADSRVRSARTE